MDRQAEGDNESNSRRHEKLYKQEGGHRPLQTIESVQAKPISPLDFSKNTRGMHLWGTCGINHHQLYPICIQHQGVKLGKGLLAWTISSSCLQYACMAPTHLFINEMYPSSIFLFHSKVMLASLVIHLRTFEKYYHLPEKF